MRSYWAEINKDKIVIYAEDYMAKKKQGLLQQLVKMRENYRRYQRRVTLSSRKRELLEMSGLEVIRDAFLALEGRWHWFTGYSHGDAFRLTPIAKHMVESNGFLEIRFTQEGITRGETMNTFELSYENLKRAYDKALRSERVVEDYTREIGRQFRERGYLEPLEVFYFICWKSPAGTSISNTWLFELINKRESVIKITREALKLSAQDRVKEAIETLIKLPIGVRVRVASAILTFYDPDRFGVIDRFAWKAIYGVEKDDFSPDDYAKYLMEIRILAEKYCMKTREVDLALWELGKQN